VEEQSGETIEAVSPLVSSVTTSFDDPDPRVEVVVDPGSAMRRLFTGLRGIVTEKYSISPLTSWNLTP
jgi:hypothetical protein